MWHIHFMPKPHSVRTVDGQSVKWCKGCEKDIPTSDFYVHHKSKSGAPILFSRCKVCLGLKQKNDPKAKERRRIYYREVEKQRRSDPAQRHLWILRNYRRHDKSQGYGETNLTADEVKELLARGCLYCGEDDQTQMGLDRIDCNAGHVRGNVNPSCSRCNWTRQDMPYAAWLQFVPVMRRCREEGFFGRWHPHPEGRRRLWRRKSRSGIGQQPQDQKHDEKTAT